jgi:DUF971 family protein
MLQPCPQCQSHEVRLYVVNTAFQYVTLSPTLCDGEYLAHITHEDVTDTVIREVQCRACNHSWTSTDI